MVHVGREMQRTGCRAAAVDRRRDDEREAHGREDRAGYASEGDSRARCVAVRRRRRKADQPGGPAAARRRESRSCRSSSSRRTTSGRRRSSCRTPTRSRGGFRPIGRRSTSRSRSSPGTRVLENVPLATLREYIDWSPFFLTWELKGKYPQIFDDPKLGEAARKLFDDAQELLDRIIDEKLLTARGVYGFWPAASEGDDIIVYADESRERRAVPLPRAAAAVGAQRPGRVSIRSPTSSRPSTAAARITSARSPSRPASAATSWPRSSTASTTTTTRS